ncbi:aminopeptidase N-like isoform X1 [Schistocerca americana]|uniref:aminopeptidase N-like isoform X1 n=2 Tax=Schistocerca americana TaxID=7009 RepID=UPI001F5007ED|nr:aminopeptidase N-like isoform X1 [Schistocerca americana]
MMWRREHEENPRAEDTTGHHKTGFSRCTAILVCSFLLASQLPYASALTSTEGSSNTQTVGGANSSNGTPSSEVEPNADTGADSGDESEFTIRRLDPRVRPLLYRLTVRPFLGEGTNFTFHGHVAITLTILPGTEVDSIVFHVKQLNISADQVTVTVDPDRQTTEAGNSGRSEALAVVDQWADPVQETHTVRVSPALQPGARYVLSVPFRGQLQEATLTGFYRTSYMEDGRSKWIALTHFEATEARSAFPCFDEPVMKAMFQINIIHSSNYTAISNMPIVHTEQLENEAGWIVDHFDTSLPMSTYLVAFTLSEMVFEMAKPPPVPETNNEKTPLGVSRQSVQSSSCNDTVVPKGRSRVSALGHEPHKPGIRGQERHLRTVQQSRETRLNASFATPQQQKWRPGTSTSTNVTGSADPVKIRILVQPGFRDRAKYVLTIAPVVLKFYEDYFQTPYPLPKLDFTAVPDFSYGGMENWGAVNYWDDRILVGPETTSDNLQRAAIHIVHEFSHQWFGNLVTPIWFSETWLKEGLATFLEYRATNFVEPTWEMPDKFLNEMHRVMLQDSTRFTRPPFTAVETVTQLIQTFDSISYSKGACLYRMLNLSLTEAVFRNGLSIFINRWKYSNAQHDDLWWSLEEAIKQRPVHQRIIPANTSLKEVMNSWILQPGFPVVTVTRNYVTGSVAFKQARFTIDGRPLANSSSQAWFVPVSYLTQEEATTGAASTLPRVWLVMSEGQRSVTVERILPSGSVGASQWLLVNFQQAGYYKVNYDVDNWKLLVQQLATNPLMLPAATRAQLISDAFSLARAGTLPYGITLNLTRYLRDSRVELNPVPWQAFLEDTQFLEDGLYVTRTYSSLKRYVQSVLEPLVQQLNTRPRPGDSLPTKQLRALALSRLVQLQTHSDWAQEYFAQWMAAPNNYLIPPDLRSAVFCAAAMKGSETEFSFLMEQLNNTATPSLRNELLSGVMCSQEPARILMLLTAPLEGKILDIQDTPTVWQAVPRNPAARTVAFEYIREQWTNLTSRFPDTDYPLNDMLDGATAGLSTAEQLDQLKAFIDSHQGQFNFTITTIERAVESLQEKVTWRQRFQADIAEWLNSPASGLSREL